MPARILELEAPLGGLDKSLAAQKQRPFTTRHAPNMRPAGSLEKRLRLGPRPGLVKSFSRRISGSSNPIRMLTVMRSLAGEDRKTFTEDFESISEWTAMDDVWVSDGGLRVVQLVGPTGTGIVSIRADEDKGSILNDGQLTSIEDSSSIINAPYTIEVHVDNFSAGASSVASVFLYARLDDTNPSEGSNVIVQLQRNQSDIANFIALRIGIDGRASSTNAFITTIQQLRDVTLRLRIEPHLAIAEMIPGPTSQLTHLRVSVQIDAPKANQSRVALRASATGTLTGRLDDFVVRYFNAAGGFPPEAVVASAGGKIERETNTGEMADIATYNSLSIASDRHIMAVDRLGKLYIADHSDTRIVDKDGDGVIVNGRLDDTNVSDWTAHGILTEDDVVELTAITGGAGEFLGKTVGVYSVSNISASSGILLSILNGSDLTSADDATTCKYRIARGPKVFDTATDALTHWKATTGLVPVGCSIIEIFTDRIVLAGDPEDPELWFMSRYKDPLDFNYGASPTDTGRALSNADTSGVGQLNPQSSGISLPISALAAMTEDYMMFSAESEMYLLRGDINLGGIMGNISRQIGIGSRTAWARIPDGSLIFLSADGLYKFHPSQPFPERMSRERLPDELIDVVQNTDLTITLEYDVRFGGVQIWVTPETAGPTEHYWFDFATKAFFTSPLGSTDYEPLSIVYHAKRNHVMLGCRDGYIRHFDVAAADDDDTAVTKEVDYGPIPLNRGRAAIADSLEIILSEGSDDVSWTFRSGNSPEEANSAATRAAGTAKAGVNYWQSVRHYGEWAFLRLTTTKAARWAIESIRLRVLTTPTESRKI